MKIAVIDGQGGGLGKTLISKLTKEVKSNIFIVAVGTNAIAAEGMLKAGCHETLWGEAAIADYFKENSVDCIIGPIGIICSGGINGEVTPFLANIFFNLKCTKYLLPLKKHGLYIPGTTSIDLKDLVEEIINDIKAHCEKELESP